MGMVWILVFRVSCGSIRVTVGIFCKKVDRSPEGFMATHCSRPAHRSRRCGISEVEIVARRLSR